MSQRASSGWKDRGACCRTAWLRLSRLRLASRLALRPCHATPGKTITPTTFKTRPWVRTSPPALTPLGDGEIN
jgi:hypothetical protein